MNINDSHSLTNFRGEILFRRKFGKKLCFLTLSNTNFPNTPTIECALHDTYYINQIQIGDEILCTGKPSEGKNKNLLEIVQVIQLIRNNKSADITKKQNEFILKFNQDKLKENKVGVLCKKIAKGYQCKDKNCPFRHELTEEEKIKDIHKKQIQQKALEAVHSGDPHSDDNKLRKIKRNSEFADFLVKTFGIENLKGKKILDIAGGKGLTSFYLKTKYKLESVIIEPRGDIVPKRYSKQLKKSKVEIEIINDYFNIETANKYIDNCALIIGMHPDEATNDIVDTALKYGISFAVVPCCVFHCKFPDRRLKNGKEVVEYPDLIEYIREKDENIKTEFLNIEGRNRVLYKKYNRNNNKNIQQLFYPIIKKWPYLVLGMAILVLNYLIYSMYYQ